MSIKLTNNGFSLDLDSKTRVVNWDEILQIDAYKIDLVTIDSICIDIELKESIITIPEETTGWEEFTEKMLEVFPTIDKDWWPKVAFPAFAPNNLLLYKKD